MLSEQEREDLIDAISASAECVGTALSSTAVRFMAQDLESIPLLDLFFSLTRCRKEITGHLTTQDVLERLPGFVPPSEAWAICLKADQEDETVALNQHIQQAWNVTKSILEGGDKVGARMAFTDVYKTLTAKAMASGEQPKWYLSIGRDKSRVEDAIQSAISRGYLTGDQAGHYLRVTGSSNAPKALTGEVKETLAIPPPKYPMPEPDPEVVEALKGMSDREKLAYVRQSIRGATSRAKPRE